jgi:hypothetical protein
MNDSPVISHIYSNLLFQHHLWHVSSLRQDLRVIIIVFPLCTVPSYKYFKMYKYYMYISFTFLLSSFDRRGRGFLDGNVLDLLHTLNNIWYVELWIVSFKFLNWLKEHFILFFLFSHLNLLDILTGINSLNGIAGLLNLYWI